MALSIDTLLTIYGIYLVFLIFCFQEINNKMRHAQDRFRQWCVNREREEILELLGINRDVETWLEKDLIFHLYNFQLGIEKAKTRIDSGIAATTDQIKAIMGSACDDYYGYLYQCLIFKSRSKWLALILFLLLFIIKFDADSYYVYASNGYIVILILTIGVMILGPEFDLFNNPIAHRIQELKNKGSENLNKEEREELEVLQKKERELRGLIKEI